MLFVYHSPQNGIIYVTSYEYLNNIGFIDWTQIL